MTDRCDCGARVGEAHLPACHYTGIVSGNERYNVADMQGNPIPDEVDEDGTFIGHDGTEYPSGTTFHADGSITLPEDEGEASPVKWDLRDEDGELHSPSWYLDAFMTAREGYLELHAMDIDGMTPAQAQWHMERLDDALTELNIYEGYVNKLFGYSGE